ncbi:MAG TPA: hypothetical protein VFE34_15910 [Dongiaceae bacterium]|nr:hypothetical protein [Dongiaceae bacterium]
MSLDHRAAAARNNAHWCDAMARAHSGRGAFSAVAWINPLPAPRFYPNLVTLGGPDDRAAHLNAIRDLMAEKPAPGWAVKDSFAALDLAPLGFRLLLEADWIHRPARAFGRIDPSCRASRVTSLRELELWEEAWRAGAMEPRGSSTLRC